MPYIASTYLIQACLRGFPAFPRFFSPLHFEASLFAIAILPEGLLNLCSALGLVLPEEFLNHFTLLGHDKALLLFMLDLTQMVAYCIDCFMPCNANTITAVYALNDNGVPSSMKQDLEAIMGPVQSRTIIDK